jgi:hypothetical protein
LKIGRFLKFCLKSVEKLEGCIGHFWWGVFIICVGQFALVFGSLSSLNHDIFIETQLSTIDISFVSIGAVSDITLQVTGIALRCLILDYLRLWGGKQYLLSKRK